MKYEKIKTLTTLDTAQGFAFAVKGDLEDLTGFS